MDRIEVRRAGLRDREKRYYLNILPVLSLLHDYMFDYEVIGKKGDMPIIKVKVGEVPDFHEAIAEFVIAEDNLEDCYAAVERGLRSIDIQKLSEKDSFACNVADIILDCISALQIRRHNKELLAKVLVAMNRTGNVRIITDYVPVCGQKLMFVSNNEFVFNMDANKGVIFSPGNGHTVGYWRHINGELHIGFYENSGDLRQLVNNIFPYLYHFNIKTKRVTEIKYRIKGKNELKKFAEIMFFDIREKRREGIIVIEGVYADKVVCLIEYDSSEGKIETIDLCGVSAETVNDVFRFFGKCKYTGNVRSTAITDGVKTEFGNFDILETFENFVYKVTDFGEHQKSLMTTDMLNNYLRVLNGAHKNYKVVVERYDVRVSPYGKKYLMSGNKQIYTVKG